jgi:hypothetical protein
VTARLSWPARQRGPHAEGPLAAIGGAPPYQLQADLGHARLETSQRYVHWAKGLADSAVDWLPIGRLT